EHRHPRAAPHRSRLRAGHLRGDGRRARPRAGPRHPLPRHRQARQGSRRRDGRRSPGRPEPRPLHRHPGALDPRRRAAHRSRGPQRDQLRLQRHPMQILGDVPRHGPRRARRRPLLQPRRRLLRGLRPEAQAGPHPDADGRRLPLRLPLPGRVL
ncbi:MAG: L-2-amino-thiazoline-4-carboxylic acid hydrolase, partial [uncultured Craurococcus sp.]